jgi:glutathione S-transferase
MERDMKLYYYPGACSLAVHIVLREAGYTFDLVKVDLRKHLTETGEDFYAINPKGYVPALRLDDGAVLTEDATILLYLADQKPTTQLAPPVGTMEHVRLTEWLNFISTEIHKTLGALFHPKITPEWRDAQIKTFNRRCKILAAALDEQPYLMGERFTVADAYLFTVLGWTNMFKLDMSKWPAIGGFVGRVADRPAVQAAMKAEGLIS